MEQLKRQSPILLAKTLLVKVEIKLSRKQIDSLVLLMKFFMGHAMTMSTLQERVTCFHIYQIYEKKIRPRLIMTKINHKIKLDLPQAMSMLEMLSTMNAGEGSYEYALIDYITSEIDQQTI